MAYMMKVRLWGPAGDMAASSQGYFVQDENGRFFRSTVVIVPSPMMNQADLEEGLHQPGVAQQERQDEEQHQPVELPGGEERSDGQRGHEKQRGEEEQVQKEEVDLGINLEEDEDEEKTLKNLVELAKKAQDYGGGLEALSTIDSGAKMMETEDRECFVLAPHDPPRKRYVGKNAPRREQGTAMVFRAMVRGVERAPNNWAGGSHPVACETPEDEVEEIMLKQHVALGRWINEVAGMANQGVAIPEEMELVNQARVRPRSWNGLLVK